MKPFYMLSLLLCLCFSAQSQILDSLEVRLQIDNLITLSDSLRKEKKWDDALSLVWEAHEKCLEAFGNHSLLHAKICSKKGLIHHYKKEPLEAEAMAKEAMAFFDINESLIKDQAYIDSYFVLINTFVDQGEYDKAETLQFENLDKTARVLGKNSQEYARCLNRIGNYFYHIGSNKKAEPHLIESLVIYENSIGKNNPQYASSLISLGHVKSDFGEYEHAESLYLEAQTIFESNEELNEHPYYMNCLDGLGTLYYNLGQYEKVGEIDTKNLKLKEKVLGKLHPAYARSLNNLAILYKDLEQYDKAVLFLLECKEIEEELLGTNNPSYAGTLINLGNVHKNIGNTEKALKYYEEAMKIFESNEKFQTHEFYMSCLTSLGNIYTVTGENDKAEAYYLKDIEVRKNLLGKNHYTYSTSLDNLAILYKDLNEYDKATPLFEEANNIRRTVLLKASKHLSESELLNLIKLFSENQNAMLSFAYLSDKLESTVYDNSLFYKGYLLNASLRIKQLAQTDTASYNLHQRLKAYYQELSDLYTAPPAQRDTLAITSLEEKVNNNEKKLTKSVAGFGEAIKQVYWQDVQAALGPNEIAVEFEHFSIFNPGGPDTIMYAALLLKPEGKPELVSLFNQEEINHLLSSQVERRSDYVNDLYAIESRGATLLGKPKKTLYELIWQPIESHISENSTIYFSPSGLLHRINIPAIPFDDELSLCDQYSFVQINSTRQLLSKNLSHSLSNNALLMGGIEYELESTQDLDELNAFVASRGELSSNTSTGSLRGGTWNYLKYTEKEVTNIGWLLSSNGYPTAVQTGAAATEELFRQNGSGTASPSILHLATHGFFFPDPKSAQTAVERDEPIFKTSDHPMIRSGLILAGGNHVWQGKTSIQGKEDGVLTAYEISQMDLTNTELVVLSACETGLGDIEGNEGVYGLQRAFKIAGAKYLIMSLWQIPDRETKDFMVSFYEHLLEDKMTIPNAFRLTQKEMKERFYNPHQWAGFVLVE